MPRQSRIIDEDAIYHIMCRGNNKTKIFHVGHDYKKYVSNLFKYKELYGFELYAFALLPNHLHMLIKPDYKREIAGVMRSINVSYSLWHNRRYDCIGHVWQDRFKSRIIRDSNDLLNCMGYIEMNPIRAGLANSIEGYMWSSRHNRFSRSKDSNIDLHAAFLELGSNEYDRKRRYYELVFRDGSQARQCALENRP
jgi:putative transposase